MSNDYAMGVLLAMGAVTFALRALPFVGAQWLRKHPMVQRLGKCLPLAIMTLLVLHAVMGSAAQHARGPWYELLAIAAVVLLQWRWRNALLSILVGAAIYVLLRNIQ